MTHHDTTDIVVYLAGPINACTDSECIDWREEAKAGLRCKTLDPMRCDYRGRENDCTAEIVEGDKIDLDAADILLAMCPKPSAGTSMEILYCWERGKAVIAIVPESVPVSPWVRFHSKIIFTDLCDAVSYINHRLEQGWLGNR